MLDAETKRRIDTARDILVGKVPDPKSQVEQITIALIYKFMDDIDAQSEALGGQRGFFADAFAQYGWAKLMRGGLGGYEMLALYAEAIAKMPENPGIPQLFRSIFNNAFLPYRDPETLRAFLKVIDEFEYDHSERLGDAFEYLLSVLGSQGDAGQFRTPRHIIDFTVGILDPKKDETVLDPACGTAGFLISSYKHILKANTDDKGNSTLTPDEKGALATNFKGYDISPDMVRLSLVNLYLHGFVAPQIYEYDTLTSEERWAERADVILANPPFMSPKGGIRPHSRFSVKSKRSEVLFVDYIAEHLTVNGRAGIIVPEGIIFQSQNAHKQLRKMLVDEYLVAVVSLPAGVFQPYSGVKTSILILDKSLARQTDHLAFFKVANDGFDLGAQRRPIAENDLPQVQTELAEYLSHLRTGKPVDTSQVAEQGVQYTTKRGLVIEKDRIAEGGEYNLSGERYKKNTLQSVVYPLRKIGAFIETITPPSKIPKTAFRETGQYPIIDQSQQEIAGWTDDETVLMRPSKPLVIFGDHTCAVKLIETPFAQGADGIKILRTAEAVDPRFLYHILRTRPLVKDGYRRHFSKLKEYEIPLPPLEVQREIVAEIEGYQRVIDGARAVVENYRPHVAIDPGWPVVEIGKACTVNPRKSELAGLDKAMTVSFVPMSDMGENTMYFSPKDSKRLEEVGTSYTYFRDDDVLIAKVTPCFENGKAGIAKGLCNGIGFGSSEFYVLRPSEIALPEWIFLCVATPAFRVWATPKMTGTGGLQRVPRSVIENYKIPLPSLKTQRAIVAEIEAEQALVDGNRELIERFEKKIRDAVGRVWGEIGTATGEDRL